MAAELLNDIAKGSVEDSGCINSLSFGMAGTAGDADVAATAATKREQHFENQFLCMVFDLQGIRSVRSAIYSISFLAGASF